MGATPEAPIAIADRQHHQYHHERPVSALLTRPALSVSTSSLPGPSAVEVDDLSPGHRYEIATRATTSDAEYRKLFEYNRREIRDGGARCHKCGRQTNPSLDQRLKFAAGSHMYGVDFGMGACICPKIVSVSTESLDAPGQASGSGSRATSRPQSARFAR